MSKLGISTGVTPNDGTGDNLLAGAIKINSNFDEIYNYFGNGTDLNFSKVSWNSTSVGIHTLSNVGLGTTNPRFALEVGAVGSSGTSLWVNGDARIIGILTVGSSSITLNGSSNTINVGSGITINGSTGTISATSIIVGGTTLTGSGVTYITAGSGISVDQNTGNVTITATGGGGSSQWISTAAGIHTLSNVGIGTTNPTSKLTVKGDVSVSGIATFNSSVHFNTNSDYISLDALNNRLLFRNNQLLVMGNGGQFSLSHDGTTTNLLNSGPFVIKNNSVSGVTSIVGNTVGTIADFTQDGEVRIPGKLQVGTGGTVITTTSGGLVGIGTTNPTSALTVNGLFNAGDGYFTGIVTSQNGGFSMGANNSYFTPGRLSLSGNIYWGDIYYYDSDFNFISNYTGIGANYGIGDWIFQQRGSGGSLTEVARITGLAGNASFSGSLSASSLRVGTGGTVITTTSNGLVGIGTTNPTSKLTVQGDVSVSGVSTFSGTTSITNTTESTDKDTGALIIEGGVGIEKRLNVGGNLSSYGDYANFGTNSSLQFDVGASVSPNVRIRNIYAGGRIRMDSVSGIDLEQYNSSSAYRARFDDTNVSLYSSANLKLQTIGAGVTVTGTTFTNELSVSGVSTFTGAVSFGTTAYFGEDDEIVLNNKFKIYNNGSNTLLKNFDTNTGGDLYIQSDVILLQKYDGTETIARFTEGAGVELNYQGQTRLTTIDDGVIVGSNAAGVVHIPNELRIGTVAGNQSNASIMIANSSGVGIGTTNPTSALTVRGGDISVGVSTSHGVILTSPNGTQYRLIVADDGTLSTVAI